MRKLYEKNEVLFAVLWIVVYCLVMAPLKGKYDWSSGWMLLALLLIAAVITAFVGKNRLAGKYGLTGWPRDTKPYLYLLPMWILATANLWDGLAPAFHGLPLLAAVLSMILVGYVEELLFRGFLFRALLKKDGPVPAIVISAVTFGIGHIVNLLAGQANLDTVIQVFFAIAWGFIFTLAFCKGGSLWPCIIIHSLVDVASVFAVDNITVGLIYMIATIAVAAVYVPWLWRQETQLAES